MSTKLVEKEEWKIDLPLCEANRELVLNPSSYASNVVFKVGPLTLIDKAP